jgi:hypothetical protein
MKRNLVIRSVGSILVACQNGAPPSDEEWGRLIRETQAALRTYGNGVRAYVLTAGGAPNAAQRATLQKEYAKAEFKTAVISDSVGARMTSSSVALLNRFHRSFGRAEKEKAHAWLGLKPNEVQAIELALQEMSTELA